MLAVEQQGLDDDQCARSWASSGVMHLTGPASGPPSVSPAGIVRPLRGLAGALASATSRLGSEVRVDPLALASQRAAFTGFGRNGSRSPGGFAQMVWARDGWVTLNLPRPSDTEALPALVGAAVPAGAWGEIEGRIAGMAVTEVVERGSQLGLAVAGVGATGAPQQPWSVRSDGPGRRRGRAPVVVDLTSLWAGPVAGGLLAEAGCRVLKVESSSRPDGARRGPAGFFELLNGRKEHLSLDLPEPVAVNELRQLIARADLVLEASRPRVMHQWDICADQVVEAGTAWVSITGHGRQGPSRNRIAFGDDAAVSGGLVVSGDPPLFVGDAIADPIAGLAAASVAADLLAQGRAAQVDVSLASASAWVRAHAGAPIHRPVVRTGSGWAVELSDGPVPVHPPAVPDGLTTPPKANS
ncbi:MAG: CoA transferase [Acidimicrobiaceae bacterium]|nr:CoA transferase [Acidimicrobiaceae bacterium]MXZ66687.1 CoA transferase [Acidimicrobiaceae bacterium]MYF33259.1 CoA transferase [Acidimicrobiaceae bacterium]MYG79999.1 CoA transferase [Acidimicrobiaceae bacterium]MYJ83751.1 CoA transferase [Acidimicrobiaceae bacterium]